MLRKATHYLGADPLTLDHLFRLTCGHVFRLDERELRHMLADLELR